MDKSNILISAIVSVYNCERYIRGCIEDLERQTIADRIEIIIINSGSMQNEESIIYEFKNRFDNIIYIKTKNRETIYQAWNRGIRVANGKYITNANSDDRHRRNAFEVMVEVLENNRNIDLVYADDIITKTENEIFENCTPVNYRNWPEYDRYKLLSKCFIGPHPMWEKKLHDKFGFFKENLEVAGDYEFWLRICEECTFKHINKYLGLYLINPNSIEHKNFIKTRFETARLKYKYIMKAKGNKKKLRKIKKEQSDKSFSLGYKCFINSDYKLSREAFLRSINYNSYNIKSYRLLCASYLPKKLITILKRTKQSVKSLKI